MTQKIQILISICLFVSFPLFAQRTAEQTKAGDYEVAVYYFPNYHPDSINARWHGRGWTEWEVVKAAKPRFEGHEQPKVPSMGILR